ncbi:MAG: hypothetical protein LCH81_05690 [Bacteroidetes bacterium]|nr:hypothetical protein [Bacteroidota bacterium]
MAEERNNSFANKIANQKQAANQKNEKKEGLSKSALSSSTQKVIIPKQPEFDQAGWHKEQAEKQKAVEHRLQQSQKEQQPQKQHQPSALQRKAQEQLRMRKTHDDKTEVAKTEAIQKQAAQKSLLQQKAQQTKSASPPKRVTVKAPPTKGRSK